MSGRLVSRAERPFSGFQAAIAALLAFGLCAGCGGSDSSDTTEVESPAEETGGSPGEEETTSSEMTEATKDPTADPADLATPGAPVVLMRTTLGDLRIELYPQEAPVTVENFLRYVEDGHYDGTIFHRVVRGFVIQGGGFSAEMEEKETRDPVLNEAQNGLRNLRGTLSMARTSDPHSATSQFFVNTTDNAMLDHTGTSMRGWGYAVFGKVIAGMEAVERIEATPVVSRAGHNDVPETPVVIESASVVSR